MQPYLGWEVSRVEVELRKKIDRLEWFIERLQAALGVAVEAEVQTFDGGYTTKVNFSLTLENKLWEEAKHYPVVADAIKDALAHKVDRMLQGKANGWIEKAN